MSTSHDETIEQPPTQQPEQKETNGVEESTSNKDVAGGEVEKAQTEDVGTVIEQKDALQIEFEAEKTSKVDSEGEADAIAGQGTVTLTDAADGEAGSAQKDGAEANKPSEAQSTGTKESDAAVPAAIASSLARPLTPSSRTSTPPLNSSSSGAKKFSSVNVNKKFLSKTVTPAAGSPAGGAKLGLSSTSPVPISTTSRLLSTKLTTVPSKTSQSPLPSTSATSTPSSSPWAKPALVEPESSIKAPAPTKARMLSSIQPVTMGSGQGIAVAKAAWRPVTQEGKRGVGLSRDFPTAKEVADGKRDAAAIAQAKAAHNQAIMQELNAFTQLDPNARHWEDDDDDDEVIDFGDGITYPHHDPPARPANEAPVTKSERFVEDFDRSWPRQRPAQSDETTTSSGLPRRLENDRDRVLFNASSNRLEPPSSRPQPPSQPQPTRLMSRPEPSRPATLDRSLPPHLQAGDGGRALPPHMLHAPAPSAQAAPSSRPLAPPTRPPAQAPGSVRQPWGAQRDDNRPLPPHLQPPASHDRNTLPPQSTAFNSAQPTGPPSHPQAASTQRRSFSQIQRPPSLHQTASASPQAPAALPATSPAAQAGSLPPKVDDQTAEMHSAAEKARLRRLAEEQEREAAAERARRKAKELEERLGLKNAAAAAAPAPTSSTAAPAAAAPPSAAPTAPAPTAPRAGFTLAQRPQSATQPQADRTGSSGLPARPTETRISGREAEGSWRTRVEQPAVEAKPEVSAILPRSARGQGESPLAKGSTAPSLQARTSSNVAPTPSRDLPPHTMPPVITQQPALPSTQPDVSVDIADALLPSAERPQKREQTFDNMLARIQAAMKEARTTPTAIEEIEAIVAEVSPPAEVAPTTASRVSVNSAAAKPVQQPAPPPAPRIIIPEPSVTQNDIPKSPPPAWRTYTVRIPKTDQMPRPSLPLPRIRAFENYRAVNPKGWLMSFDPPIEGLSSVSLSRSEHFLPAVKTKRFGKTVDVSPMVSISPRTLEPYVKKDKKKVDAEKESSGASQTAPVQVGANGARVAEALLGGETVVSAPGEALRRSQATQEAQSAYQPQSSESPSTSPVSSRTFPRAVAPSATASAAATTQPPAPGMQSNRWSSDKLDAIAQPVPKPPASVQALEAARKLKSPVKQSLAAKAEKDGLFTDDAVGIRNPAQRERALSDAKPGQGGVRFMVSSELEGDSLLDEVNKISLEMVGEGVDGRERSEGKSGVDVPGTPAKVSNSTRTGTSPTSASTWSNGPVRSTPHGSQHDLMKSMWEQTPAGGSTKEASTRSDQYISPLVPSTSNTDIATPMYPSLNAPSSTDTASQSQALSAGMKMPYSSQPAFSPTGGAQQQPYARSPQYPGTSGTYSPDPHSMYGRSTPGSVNGISMGNTNGAQAYGMHQQQQQIPQAVWSPSAFGAGYGYTNKSTPPVGDKAAAAMAFASASPVGGADYRYGAQQSQGHGAGAYGYGHGHGAHQHQAHGQNQAYGVGAYGRQQVTSPVGHGYGYYGAAGGASGQAGRGGGRFGANAGSGAGAGAGAAAAAAIAAGAGAVNGDHGYGYNALEGGYYGGVGGGAGGGGSGQQYGYAQGGHGAIGSQQQQQLLLQQQQQHLQQGRAASALSAQQRKMWQ